MIGATRRHPLGAFFTLAFAISWAYWIPVAIAGGHVSHFPGLTGPLLAAVVTTAVCGGRAGLRRLGRRMVRWRVAGRWYAACLVPLATALVVVAAQAAAGTAPSRAELSAMPGLPTIGWLGVFVLTFLVNGLGEETGWRGFAWPALRERHSLPVAAFGLAVPWAVWHLPTFWIDSGLRGFPLVMLPGFFAGMAAGAVVLGWLYERSGSSVFIVALFHTALNMASATEGTESAAALVSVVVIAWAVGILRRDRTQASRRRETPMPSPMRLEPSEPTSAGARASSAPRTEG